MEVTADWGFGGRVIKFYTLLSMHFYGAYCTGKGIECNCSWRHASGSEDLIGRLLQGKLERDQ